MAKQHSQLKFVHGEVVLSNEARNGCLQGNATAEMFCKTEVFQSHSQMNRNLLTVICLILLNH